MPHSTWSSSDGRAFERKIGVPLVTGRRGGLNAVHAELLMWMYIRGFVTVGSRYWNICFTTLDKGSWDQDEEFRRNVQHLAENVAWVHERLNGRRQALD